MCSIFGLTEKIESRIEDIVNKLEKRISEVEEKQDNDYDSNKDRFSEMEKQIEDLNETLSDQKQFHQRQINELEDELLKTNSRNNELESRVRSLSEELKTVSETFNKLNQDNLRLSNLEAETNELKEKIQQQSGLVQIVHSLMFLNMPIKSEPNFNTIFLCIIHKSIFNHESARNVSSLEKSIFSKLKIPQENF